MALILAATGNPGTASWVDESTISSGPEYGLQVLYVDADTVSLSPGRIMADDETTMMEVTATTNFDLSTMTARPTSDLAYPWLGVDAGGTPSFWCDTSKTTPTETPAGIVAKRYIGPALYQNSASDNIPFTTSRAGRTVTIHHQERSVYSGTISNAAPNPQAFGFSTLAPDDADFVMFNVACRNGYQAFWFLHDAVTTARAYAMQSQDSFNRNNSQFTMYIKGMVTAGTIYVFCDRSVSTEFALGVAGHRETV